MQLMRSGRAKLSAIVVLGGATAIAACSSASITEVSGGFGGSSGVVGGSASGTTTATSAMPPRCPEEAPGAGSGCTGSNGARCHYGPDLRNACADQSFECTSSGRWKAITRDECAVRCPETFATIVPGTTCGDIEMACNYEEGTCGCMGDGTKPDAGAPSDAGADASDAGEGGTVKVPVPGVWKCVPPPATVGCPSVRPHVLNECVKAVTCDYGTCELGRRLSYDCTGKAWEKSLDSPSCDE